MKKFLMNRTTYESPKQIFLRGISLRYISRLNEKYARQRSSKMAVYANDWVGLLVYLDGEYEKEDLADVFHFLERIDSKVFDGVALDIGANIGNHSIRFSKDFESVYSFEPNPSTFKLLEFNTFPLSNVNCFNLGLSDIEGELILSEDLTNLGGSSAVIAHNYGSQIKIEVKKLDDVLKGIKNIRLIKVDVEGMELNVFQGAFKTISENKPFIIFEQNEIEFSGEMKESSAISYLRGLGYRMVVVDVSRNKRSWFYRRFFNVFDFIFGRRVRREFYCVDDIEKGDYPLIIAIPDGFVLN